MSTNKNKETKKKQKIHTNQVANIKVSQNTKRKIDILLQLTDNKFAYEMIEDMIEVYINQKLTIEQKKAFKDLSNVMKKYN